MSDYDPNRLRWGDITNLNFALGAGMSGQTIQLVNTRAHGLPETWKIFLYAKLAPQVVAAGDNVACLFKVTLGVGGAPVTFGYGIDFTTAAPSQTQYLQANNLSEMWTFLEVPARDLQINCTVLVNLVTAPASLVLGAWAAPLVPAALALPGQAPPERGPHTWMGPGFHPEPLHYK
jgi:hypothetical protein